MALKVQRALAHLLHLLISAENLPRVKRRQLITFLTISFAKLCQKPILLFGNTVKNLRHRKRKARKPSAKNGKFALTRMSSSGRPFLCPHTLPARLICNLHCCLHRTKTVRLTGENRENPVMKAASRTVPPGKVRRFAETRLHLRSDKRSSSWQRKPCKLLDSFVV